MAIPATATVPPIAGNATSTAAPGGGGFGGAPAGRAPDRAATVSTPPIPTDRPAQEARWLPVCNGGGVPSSMFSDPIDGIDRRPVDRSSEITSMSLWLPHVERNHGYETAGKSADNKPGQASRIEEPSDETQQQGAYEDRISKAGLRSRTSPCNIDGAQPERHEPHDGGRRHADVEPFGGPLLAADLSSIVVWVRLVRLDERWTARVAPVVRLHGHERAPHGEQKARKPEHDRRPPQCHVGDRNPIAADLPPDMTRRRETPFVAHADSVGGAPWRASSQ